jgi:hypothetical protein
MEVNMGDGSTEIRVMDIVARKAGQSYDDALFVEIKTFKERKKNKNKNQRKRLDKAQTARDAQDFIRGAFMAKQVNKDRSTFKHGARIQRNGGHDVKPGKSTRWVGFMHDGKNITKQMPPQVIGRDAR